MKLTFFFEKTQKKLENSLGQYDPMQKHRGTGNYAE